MVRFYHFHIPCVKRNNFFMLEDAETKIFIQYRNITYIDICYMDNSLEHHDKSSEGEEAALDLHLDSPVVKVANPTSQLQFPAEIK